MTTTQRPRTALKPASVAAVSPALALSRTSRTRGSALAEAADDLGAPVAAAVVHEDDLVAEAGRLEHLADLRPEEREVLLLVVDGDDDGEVERGGHPAPGAAAGAVTRGAGPARRGGGR